MRFYERGRDWLWLMVDDEEPNEISSDKINIFYDRRIYRWKYNSG